MRVTSLRSLDHLLGTGYAENDIGPVRAVYYNAIQFCAYGNPAKRYHPFGPLYGEFQRADLDLGGDTIDPEEWRSKDDALSDDLASLGVKWTSLEGAMLEAFCNTIGRKLQPFKPGSEVLEHWYAMRALHTFTAETRQFRKAVELYGRAIANPITRRFLGITDERNLNNPFGFSGMLSEHESRFEALRLLFLAEPKGARQAFEDYWRLNPELVAGRISGSHKSHSKFNRPIAKAAHMALWNAIDTKSDPTGLPPEIAAVLHTRCTDDPEDTSYSTRKEWWELLARILNHLPILFGTRTRPVLSAQAVRSLCTRS